MGHFFLLCCSLACAPIHSMSSAPNLNHCLAAFGRPNERRSFQAVRDDVSGILHLGRVVPADLWLLAEPGVWSLGTMDHSGGIQSGGGSGPFLQYAVRRPKLRRGEVCRLQPSRGRVSDLGVVLDSQARHRGECSLLAILRLDACSLSLLRADYLNHKFHRLRKPQGSTKGIRPCATMGYYRLD